MTMSVSFQNEARRENARKSTGPKTKAGKARSRANSVKHGLAGSGICLAPDLKEVFEQRRHGLAAVVARDDDHSLRVEEQLVLAGLRVDACRMARHVAVSKRWDLDHEVAALELAEKVHLHPERISRQLERSWYGTSWKIGRWEHLLRQLEKNGKLTPEEEALAYDLLGVPQMERPDSADQGDEAEGNEAENIC